MALDFHLGLSSQIAQVNLPALSLELAEHSRIFDTWLDKTRNFPLLARLANYFDDATFEAEETAELAREIARFRFDRRLLANETDWLGRLENMASGAAKQKLGLFAFCD